MCSYNNLPTNWMILIKKVTACEEKQKRVCNSLLLWKEVKEGVKIPTSS